MPTDYEKLKEMIAPFVVEFENETLERAALVAESFEDAEHDRLSSKTRHLTAQAIAREIRALKTSC